MTKEATLRSRSLETCISDRDFICGMHTPLIMPFQMTLTVTFMQKLAFYDFVSGWGILSISQMHIVLQSFNLHITSKLAHKFLFRGTMS